MKRFFKDVAVEPREEGGWQVTLDGRGIRTQGGAPQVVPSQPCAELLAGEWRAQGDKIDLRSFVYRDLADFALDVVAADRGAAIDKLLGYAETDTLCYRADPDEPLFRRQEQVWEPLVSACEARHGLTMQRVSGIMHRPQAPATLASLRSRLEGEDDFTLAALVTMASLAASLVVSLATLEDGADAEALFAAANLEEDWQAQLWGVDAEAEKVRAARLEAFVKAGTFLNALNG